MRSCAATSRAFSFSTSRAAAGGLRGGRHRQIEMHFLPASTSSAKSAGQALQPRRAPREVPLKGRRITEILEMMVYQALVSLRMGPSTTEQLQTCTTSGMVLHITSLVSRPPSPSGGEARGSSVPPNDENGPLGRPSNISDEADHRPPTSTHVARRLSVLGRLARTGNTVAIVIEHTLDVISAPIGVIDLVRCVGVDATHAWNRQIRAVHRRRHASRARQPPRRRSTEASGSDRPDPRRRRPQRAAAPGRDRVRRSCSLSGHRRSSWYCPSVMARLRQLAIARRGGAT